MRIGIVGHAAEKFTKDTEWLAKDLINSLVCSGDTVVSGRSPMGGIDVWAEEEADRMGLAKLIFPPSRNSWEGGFKERNLLIAKNSDIVHVIVVSEFPPHFAGKRFPYCYHCKTDKHIKSGACWTALRAPKAEWHVL